MKVNIQKKKLKSLTQKVKKEETELELMKRVLSKDRFCEYLRLKLMDT